MTSPDVAEALIRLTHIIENTSSNKGIYIAVGITFLGIAATIFAQWLATWWEHKKRREAIANALCSEVETIVNIITVRRYLGEAQKELAGVRDHIAYIGNPDNKEVDLNYSPFDPYLELHNDDYWCVYKTNAKHIGLLDRPLSILIPHFYVVMFSLLEDAQYGGARIKKSYEHMNGIDERTRYYNTLDALANMLDSDIKLLQDLLHIGKLIIDTASPHGVTVKPEQGGVAE